MKIELSKERKTLAIKEIQKYFSNERDEDLGDLSATLLLDFFVEKLGPMIYNQGIHDAVAFFQEKAEDIYNLEK